MIFLPNQTKRDGDVLQGSERRIGGDGMKGAKFFTGKPCNRGHICERYESTNNCVECVNWRRKQRRADPVKYAREIEHNRIRMGKPENRDASKKRMRHRRATEPGLRKKQSQYERFRTTTGRLKPTRPEPALCEWCGQPPHGRRDLRGHASLHLHHCHDTGWFIAWICHSCNVAEGYLRKHERWKIVPQKMQEWFATPKYRNEPESLEIGLQNG